MKKPTAVQGVSGLLGLAGGLGFASAVLAARAAALVPRATAPAARVETWVELAVVGAAEGDAAWVALGALIGLTIVGVARAGRRWRLGEAVLRRLAPSTVRRLVRSGVGMAVGAGLVLAPTAAFAAPAEPAPAPVAAEARAAEGRTAAAGGAVGGGGPVDLSWRPTVGMPAAEPSDALLVDTPQLPGSARAEQRTGSSSPEDGGPPPVTTPAIPASPVVATITVTPAPAPAEAAAAPTSAARDPEAGTVVVHRGDTLWDLAARTLGDHPTDAQVLAETVRWHDANRDVIGDDPDLILPGQILVRPS